MPERLTPRRRRGGRRHKRVTIYDTDALLLYFDTDSEDEVKEELKKRGISWHESAGKLWVSGYLLER